MHRSRTHLLTAVLIAGTLVAGCMDNGVALPSDDALIEQFVAASNLPEAHGPAVRPLVNGASMFVVRYGPPHDCPSGCFFDTAYGLHYRGRVGWMYFTPSGQPQNHAFDFHPEDADLFSAGFARTLDSANRFVLLSGSGPLLVSDADASPEALVQVARGRTYPATLLGVLDHPNGRSNRSVLVALTELPEIVDYRGDIYKEVRDLARERLAELGG